MAYKSLGILWEKTCKPDEAITQAHASRAYGMKESVSILDYIIEKLSRILEVRLAKGRPRSHWDLQGV